MSEIVHDNGQWGVVASNGTTWFDDEKAAKQYASITELSSDKAAQVLDELGDLATD